MKHLNRELERLEQRIAPGMIGGGHRSAGSGSKSGGSKGSKSAASKGSKSGGSKGSGGSKSS